MWIKLWLFVLPIFTISQFALCEDNASAQQKEEVQRLCLLAFTVKNSIEHGGSIFGDAAFFYEKYRFSDKQDLYCVDNHSGVALTIGQLIQDISTRPKIVELAKSFEDGPIQVPTETNEDDSTETPEVSKNVALEISSDHKIINNNCFQALKLTLAEPSISKPIIEIQACGNCQKITTAPDGAENIKLKNLRIFSQQSKLKESNLYLNYFSMDMTADCTYYTFINPSVKPLKQQKPRFPAKQVPSGAGAK